MKATCPKCGYILHVKRRADGTGTQPDGSDLSEREEHLLGIMKQLTDPMTVREIQDYIFADETRRGGFSNNYHLLQATLSTLAGRGLVKMERAGMAWRYQA